MKSLQLHKPHLLVVIGLPGAGKSFFASQFAATFNAPYIDYERYLSLLGDPKLAGHMYDEVLSQILRTKQTIVIDGIGSRKSDRMELANLARKHDYEIMLVWVQTEPLTAEHRAVKARGAKYSVHEYDDRVGLFEMPLPTEPTVVISGKHTYASQARVVLKRLAMPKEETIDKSIKPPAARPDHTIRNHSGRIIIG